MNSREQIEMQVTRLLKGEIGRLGFPAGMEPPPIAVIATKTSGGKRPDGLRDDVTEDPGFSFAVAEGLIELDRSNLSSEQFAASHRILWEAGTDDWMDYSHLGNFEADAVPVNDKPCLLFSSAAKAANVISKLLSIIEK